MLWVADVKGLGLRGGRQTISSMGPGSQRARCAGQRCGSCRKTVRPGPDVTWLIPLPMAAPGSPLRARGMRRRAAGRAGGAAGGGARAALAARSTRDAALPSGPAHVGDSGPRPRGRTPSAHALVLAQEHKTPNLQFAHARRGAEAVAAVGGPQVPKGGFPWGSLVPVTGSISGLDSLGESGVRAWARGSPVWVF